MLEFEPIKHFWKKELQGPKYRSLTILARHQSAFMDVNLHFKGEPVCALRIETEMFADVLARSRTKYDSTFIEQSGELRLELAPAWRAAIEKTERELLKDPSITPQALDATCFRDARTKKRIAHISMVPNDGIVYHKTITVDGIVLNPEKTSTVAQLLDVGTIVSPAFAQAGPDQNISFAELKVLLSHNDSHRRAVARRHLGANFSLYKVEATKDIFLSGMNPHYISSLLHGLIAAVDAEYGGKMAPEQPRDLSLRIPLIADREKDIVDLTGDADDGVRKQAGRLVQRYPVDAFDSVYSALLERVALEDCKGYKSHSAQGIFYGGIFYYYNRIIQLGYEVEVNGRMREDLNEAVRKGLDIATCLEINLKADSSAVLFARAFAYSRHKQFVEFSQRYADEFLKRVQSTEARYYSPSHVDVAKRIVGL